MSTSSVGKLRTIVPRTVTVEEFEDSSDSSASSSSDDFEEPPAPVTYAPEYWHIQKLIKFMKAGNDAATAVALCCLQSHDLTIELNQLAIRDTEGLELLVNLLESNSLRCIQGALSALSQLSQTKKMRTDITNLGCLSLLVKNLSSPNIELQELAPETIYHLAKMRKARKHVRKCNGIPVLIDFLDVSETCLMTPDEELSSEDKKKIGVATSAMRALWSLGRSKKNRDEMMRCGIIPLLAKLLRSTHSGLIVPTMATVSICADNSTFQLALRTENMIKDVVKYLKVQDLKLKQFCATILFKCAENPIASSLIKEAGGIDPLVEVLKDNNTKEDDMKENKRLLVAVTGAVWKAAKHEENLIRFEELKTVEILVSLLEHPEENEDVLSHTVGAISEFLKFKRNYDIVRRCGGIPYLVNLLNYTYPPLLENVALVFGRCAEDEDCMQIIEELDGVRLLWSLLKNPDPKIQANAALSLVPCIKYATDSGEMVRSFIGGLQLAVELLKSKDNEVLAAACAAIAQIAQDKENLGIISEYGTVPMLANLVDTEDVALREHLAFAIAHCCDWHTNCKTFGRLGVVTSIVKYIASSDKNVQRSAAIALFELSKNPFNCITMHESGVIPYLLKTLNTDDKIMQEASAKCLGNIRRLALEAESYHLKTRDDTLENESEDASSIANGILFNKD